FLVHNTLSRAPIFVDRVDVALDAHAFAPSFAGGLIPIFEDGTLMASSSRHLTYSSAVMPISLMSRRAFSSTFSTSPLGYAASLSLPGSRSGKGGGVGRR